MLGRRTFLFASAAALAGCARRKSAGFDGYAFVANEGGRSVAVVDLNTFTVARQIRLDANPTAVVAHAAGVSVLTPETGTVHAVGAGDLALHRRIRVARAAVSMRLSHDGSALWLLCRDPRQLARLDLREFRIDARIPLPGEPVDFDLASSGEWAATSFGEEGAFAISDLAARRTARPVRTGAPLGQVRFRSDGRQLLVADFGARALLVAEAPTGRTVVRLPLAVRPDHLCFNRDRGQLFVAGDGMDAVVVVYPYSTEVAETVLAGRAPGAMAASNAYLFVTNPQSGDVTILDIETRKTIAAVSVGEGPGFVAITPDDRYALVLNQRSGDMAVIRVAGITATRARSVALFTLIPVGSGPVSAAVRSV